MRTEPKIRFIADKPIEAPNEHPFAYDCLGFKSSVIGLSEIVQNLETPFTIGVYGRWGSGKTSFMRLLEAQLRIGGFKTFWFDAWKYENETSLLIPLLSKLCSELGPTEKIVREIKKLSVAVVSTGATAVADIFLKTMTLDTVKRSDIEKQLEAAEKRYTSWVSEVDKLGEDFKELVFKIKDGSPSLVIFIDDLDRCLPDNTIKLIENIKHFLSVEGCIFVLGVDNEVLSNAIQQRYASSIAANEYLEKIINLPVHVPEREGIEKDIYIEAMIRSMVDEKWFQKIRKEIKQFISVVADIADLTNPRKLRLLIFRYLMFLSLRDRKKYILEVVIKLIVYKEFFPDAYALKKKEGYVNYAPDIIDMSQSFKELPKEEIEKHSCKGFAEVAKKFRSLYRFSDETRNLLVLFGREDDEVDKVLNKGEHPAHLTQEQLAAIQKIEGHKQFKRQHFEYFNLVDFLFSLG